MERWVYGTAWHVVTSESKSIGMVRTRCELLLARERIGKPDHHPRCSDCTKGMK